MFPIPLAITAIGALLCCIVNFFCLRTAFIVKHVGHAAILSLLTPPSGVSSLDWGRLFAGGHFLYSFYRNISAGP